MQHERNNGGLLERPLTARSVVLSLLLGMHPPRMPAQRLVQWCELFDIAPGTTRVALSRMADRGELRARDGVYELAGRVAERQRAQDWSIDPSLGEWDGRWSLALVTVDARSAAARAALREAMRRCRYAEVREGCWTRPDNLPRAAAPDEAWAVVDEQCARWTGAPDGRAREVAAALFDPHGWAERAQELSRRTVAATERLQRDGADHLAAAFLLGAATLQHVRNDPLLPAALLPARWPGDDLRAAYRAYQAAFADATVAWFRGHPG
jgi:phenylacetic acid degradation operon negative regulatory protein